MSSTAPANGQPIGSMVERAVTLLMEDSTAAKLSERSDVVLNYTLVERDSTAPFRRYTSIGERRQEAISEC